MRARSRCSDLDYWARSPTKVEPRGQSILKMTGSLTLSVIIPWRIFAKIPSPTEINGVFGALADLFIGRRSRILQAKSLKLIIFIGLIAHQNIQT